MKQNNNSLYVSVIELITISSLGIILIMNWFTFYEVLQPIKNINYTEFDKCKGLGLEDTAYCIWSIDSKFAGYSSLRGFYDYEYFKEFGGDCKVWTYFYERVGNYLDYHVKGNQYFLINKKFGGHIFAIMYSDEGYCILDQQSPPVCYMMF